MDAFNYILYQINRPRGGGALTQGLQMIRPPGRRISRMAFPKDIPLVKRASCAFPKDTPSGKTRILRVSERHPLVKRASCAFPGCKEIFIQRQQSLYCLCWGVWRYARPRTTAACRVVRPSPRASANFLTSALGKPRGTKARLRGARKRPLRGLHQRGECTFSCLFVSCVGRFS